MDIVIKGIGFSHTPSAPQNVTIKYRKTSDPDVAGSYTLVSDNVTVPVTGNIEPDITIGGLVADTYSLVIINNCNGRGVRKDITLVDATTYVWVEDTYICAQDSVFTSAGEITNFSSPQYLMYDAPKQRVYGFDADNPNGNIFSYNPVGFTSASQIIQYPSVLQSGATSFMFAAVLDPEHRRIYYMGRDSDGIQVFNIATNSITVIPFGQNVNVAPMGTGNGFNRLLMRMVGDMIIATDRYSDMLIAIDRATATQLYQKPLSDIVGGDSFSGAAGVDSVNGEIWVVENQDGAGTPNILRYDTDFNSLGVIDISAQSQLWSNSRYWRAAYADAENNVYYVFDFGTRNLIKIDIPTRAIKHVHKLAISQGKTSASMGFVLDPVTKELYLSGDYRNSTSDNTPIYITYKINRSNQSIINVYPNTQFSNLVQIGGSNELHGASAGNVGWNGPSAWATDGKILKFTR